MIKNKGIRELPEAERPYEKCELFGVESLSDAELLAVILRSGIPGKSVLELAMDILYPTSHEKSITNLHQWNLESLCEIRGIGRVKAIQILCIAQLAIRLSKAEAKKGLCFNTPDTIAKYFMERLRHLGHEEIHILLLDTKSQLISEKCISKGGVNASAISSRELFIEALNKKASAIILLHNHPSGDPSPSNADLVFTKQIEKSGMLLGIPLLDHIIIGNNRFVSFKESSLL